MLIVMLTVPFAAPIFKRVLTGRPGLPRIDAFQFNFHRVKRDLDTRVHSDIRSVAVSENLVA